MTVIFIFVLGARAFILPTNMIWNKFNYSKLYANSAMQGIAVQMLLSQLRPFSISNTTHAKTGILMVIILFTLIKKN